MQILSRWLASGLMIWWSTLFALPAQAEPTSARLSAVLILASNTEAPADASLSDIEPKLRKVLAFDHYQRYGEGSAKIDVPGSATLQLGKGYTLFVEASEADGAGKIRLRVSWRKDGKALMSTSAVVSRGGAQAILGGPSHGDGKLLVALSVE